MGKEFSVPSFDGTRLHGVIDSAERARAVIVIVHGLCEHLGRYEYLTGKLLREGYAVYRFDHRGHGKSEGKETFYADFNEIVDDVNVIVEKAKAENPGKKVFLIGHSMGGYAVALFGTKYPGKASGIVCSGALTRYNHKLLGELPIKESPDTYVPNGLGEGVCSDPAVIKAYVDDPLVSKRISIGLMNTIYYGVEYLKANAKRFVEPVLIMHGCDDGLVAERDSREFFGEIGSKDKGLIIFPFLMHEIFNEKSKDEVIAEAVGWLNKRV
jgi:lysophospholipase